MFRLILAPKCLKLSDRYADRSAGNGDDEDHDGPSCDAQTLDGCGHYRKDDAAEDLCVVGVTESGLMAQW